jgi:hypothetical protein
MPAGTGLLVAAPRRRLSPLDEDPLGLGSPECDVGAADAVLDGTPQRSVLDHADARAFDETHIEEPPSKGALSLDIDDQPPIAGSK